MISVFTPHYAQNNKYIHEAYMSLCAQTVKDWEWIVLLNNGGFLGKINDPRIKIITPSGLGRNVNVGLLKKICCESAKGDILVELDGDDWLEPTCLEKVQEALQDADFCYSDTRRSCEGEQQEFFTKYWGWKVIQDDKGKYNQAMPPTIQAMRSIYWAPNHVRAWKTDFYNEIGGYDPKLPVCDDYDLLCRTFIHGTMKHIPEPLYNQRVHDKSTQVRLNNEIQELNKILFGKYAHDMLKKSFDKLIDLGAAHNKTEGFIGVDTHDADICCDLSQNWPFQDSEVGVIRASDFVEHLADPIKFMNEAYRVLVPGGFLLISVPSTDGRGAFQDPTHKSFWNSNSFWYYTNKAYSKYIPEYKGRFQLSRLINTKVNDEIVYTHAHLIALKDGYEPIGEVLC